MHFWNVYHSIHTCIYIYICTYTYINMVGPPQHFQGSLCNIVPHLQCLQTVSIQKVRIVTWPNLQGVVEFCTLDSPMVNMVKLLRHVLTFCMLQAGNLMRRIDFFEVNGSEVLRETATWTPLSAFVARNPLNCQPSQIPKGLPYFGGR